MSVTPFSDEQMRVLVNLEQRYAAWIHTERVVRTLPYGMRWKTSAGIEYLYEIADRLGNGRSLGRRSAATEAQLQEYLAEKSRLQESSEAAGNQVDEIGRLYRAVRLPLVPSPAAAILREADRRRLLGDHLLVIGTNAIPAYEVEAGGHIDTPDETEDFDFARSSRSKPEGRPIWSMMKEVDSTYAVNMERTFQARNSKAYEVDFLVAPSLQGNLPANDGPSAFPLPEQEWLLLGTPVDHVVVARDGSPARLIVPDPRWFALHKLWLSRQEKRNPLKRGKDATQGRAILDAVRSSMPRYPLDADFERLLPAELEEDYKAWRAQTDAGPVRRWR